MNCYRSLTWSPRRNALYCVIVALFVGWYGSGDWLAVRFEAWLIKAWLIEAMVDRGVADRVMVGRLPRIAFGAVLL